MIELKPCPICGKEPDCVMGKDNLTDTTKFRVGCNRCKVYAVGSNSKETQELWDEICSKKVGEEPELKPCPFCGGEAEIVHPYYGATGAYIFCTNCRLSIYHGVCRNDEALKELTDMWNRRVKE